MEDKENKITKKQKIVAGIIVLVAIILLVSVFSGNKEVAPTPMAPVKVENDIKSKDTSKPQAEESASEAIAESDALQQTEASTSSTVEVSKEVIKIEPKTSVLTFEATTDKALNYQIFYTVEREVWYDAGHVVEYSGEAGNHKYSIVIPSEKIFRIRIDFDSNPGEVTIKNIYLDGAQKADLNDFDGYAYNQIDAKDKNKDGSLTITSQQDDPYMEYLTPLLPE